MMRLDPQVHKDIIDRLLKKGISMLWWRLPFNNNVSQKFNQLMGCDHDFRVMIVGPDNKYVEKRGGEILQACEVDLYPFSREGFVQKELKQLHELTLESLMVIGSKNYVYKGSTTFPLAHLRGKNVLVYFMSTKRAPGNYNQVSKWYPEIKADVDDFEVVDVKLEDGPVVDYDDLEVAEKRLFIKHKTAPDTLLKFGSDGKICSFQAQDHLYARGPKVFQELGDPHLRQDVITELTRYYSFM
ncbi:putative nucleoredoxin 1-2, partial [Bienertia sinuspersici]